MSGRNIYSYMLFIFSCALVLASAWRMYPFLGFTNILLLALILAVFNYWLSGFRYGLLLTIIAALNTVYFFVARQEILPNTSLLSLLLFVAVGIISGFVIERYRKTDITNQYRRKEQDFLSRLKKLEDENIKMQNEIKHRDEFLSIASHELKTPLTSMLLRLQTILHNIRHVSLAEFSVENLLKGLETAEQQSQRLSRMINDLLNVSLITTGKFNLEKEKTNLADIAQKIVSEFDEKLKADGYTLKLKTDKQIICYIDRLRIEQAISNLLSNAVKYGNHKPIELKIEKNSHNALIEVKDHGIGIKNNNANKLFRLFERGVSENTYKGLGVGLYITNQIVKAHKGVLRVKSRPGAGSKFTIELPLRNK